MARSEKAAPKYDKGLFYCVAKCTSCESKTRRCGWFPPKGWICWKCAAEKSKGAAAGAGKKSRGAGGR